MEYLLINQKQLGAAPANNIACCMGTIVPTVLGRIVGAFVG
jgi:hypothetical protein